MDSEHVYKNDGDFCECFRDTWRQCIPYNIDTGHLLSTNIDSPNVYKDDVKSDKII